MHFWIDKRSNYGIGHNRNMAQPFGLSYQHRRIRNKAIVTPIRQHPPPSAPSTSHQHAKSHNSHHHRSRHAESAPTRTQPITENSPSSSTALPVNHHNIPIHSVYPNRIELPINHVVESTESVGSASGSISVNWPIYLKFAFEALFLLFVLVALKFCINNELTVAQLVCFGFMSIIFFMLTTTISILRMRKNRLYDQGEPNDNLAETITEPAIPNQMTMQTYHTEPPPPYAVAINFPEKQSAAPYKIHESPPPSYDSQVIEII